MFRLGVNLVNHLLKMSALTGLLLWSAVSSGSGAEVSTAAVAVVQQKKENLRSAMEWKETLGGIPEGGFYVIKDSSTWSDLWTRLREDPVPEIDFDRYMVAGAFMGLKSTGGFSISIETVVKKKKKWIVHVRERSAGSRGGFVIQAFTSPYHLKVIDRTDMEVEFEKVK